MQKVFKRSLSILLALLMLVSSLSVSAWAVVFDDSLVQSLAAVYDGDEARAREALEALYEAGIIDKDGNLVKLDVREDGKKVELDEVAQRIANGEAVGALTVNGHDATPEQLLQIRQVKSLLEIIKLMDKDVKITDEHVANLQALLEGILDGSIDLNEAIENGEMQVKAGSRKAPTRGSVDYSDLPEPNGDVDAADGTYTAPYISGSTYEADHVFTLTDPDNTKWYAVESEGTQAVSGAVVTLSCGSTVASNGTVTVTASLNKAQTVPVSFTWTAVSDTLNLSGDTSGTVTWAAGDKVSKTFTVTVSGATAAAAARGSQCVVINADSIQNAVFAGGKSVWSKAVQRSAQDKEAIRDSYPLGVMELDKSDFIQSTYLDSTDNTNHYDGYRWYRSKTKVKNLFPSSGNFTATVQVTSIGSNGCDVYVTTPDAVLDDEITTPEAFKENQPFREFYEIQYYGEPPMTFTQEPIAYPSYTGDTGETTLETVIKDEEAWITIGINKSLLSGYVAPSDIFQKITVECNRPATINSVAGVSVPAGTYSSGQIVPVTVTLATPSVAPAGTTLTVNGVQCPLLNTAGTESKQLTFGYTVKDVDSGAINVTALSDTLVNYYGEAVTLEYNVEALDATSFGTAQNVHLVSAGVKGSTLDLANAQYGIDDAAPGAQTVTVLIPFKSGVAKDWVANEEAGLTQPVTLPLPGYGNAEASYYLKSAYFSADAGATRYPVYVIGENADALAARFVPSMNELSYLRKDTVQMYMDPIVGTTRNCLGPWAGKKTDSKGYAYFTASDGAAEALAFTDASWSYYVKGSIIFDPNAYISRGDATYTVDSGFIPVGGSYVVAQDAEHPENRYDVEIVANESFFDAVKHTKRADALQDLVLRYQISDRKDFTCTEPKYFSWSSSDETIAKIVKNETTGLGQVLFTGEEGTVKFILTVHNGSEAKAYTLETPEVKVMGGKDPFLSIPAMSQVRTTLTGADTDVLFASNVTARNAAAGQANTTFTAKLYKVSGANVAPAGDAIWTQGFTSTIEDTITHITVPGSQISEPGAYAVVISVRYAGGTENGAETDPVDLSATAWLNVKQAPAKITLNTLESYSVTSDDLPDIEYTVTPASATVEYTVQKSGEGVGKRASASGGTIPFTAGTPTGLKDAYTITVYARNNAEEAWSVDSMKLTVYNADILDIIIKDVTAGEIGGTTGGTGTDASGTTVTMDNRGKLGAAGKVTFQDLTELRTDMSLQKLVSVNYGSGVWGLLSDKMQWTTSDSDTVSINYEQGGMYSDLSNYSYTSYGPATDFLLVGKQDGYAKVTATHAATGMRADVLVRVNTLKDQLYVFQFLPKVETEVTYTNGANQERSLKSNENGELVVYEPKGIKSPVMVMSEKDGETYVGTIYESELASGERDVASLQLYPCNNLRLRSISKTTLTFKKPDGTPYSGAITLRAGVYKNNVYCPGTQVFLDGDTTGRDGSADINATVTDGKLNIRFNPMQFKCNENDAGANAGDNITYVFEYRVNGCQTSYATLHAYTNMEGEQNPAESVIQLRNGFGSTDTPQITRQEIQRFFDGADVLRNRNVIDYTGNIGVTMRFNKVVLYTDYTLPESMITTEAGGNKTLSGEFGLYTANGQKLTGQTSNGTGAVEINDLGTLQSSNLFFFPFSSVVYGHHTYTITNENLEADGITDDSADSVSTTAIKAMFVNEGMTILNFNLPFGVSNLSHQADLVDPNGGAEEAAAEVKTELQSTMNVGEVFKQVKVNSMIQKGFTFLGGMKCRNDNVPFNLMILPTENPGIFRIIAFIGYNQKENEEDGLAIDYNPQAMYDDISSLIEEESSPVNVDFRFSGTLILEAGCNLKTKKWSIDFCGGSVGLGMSVGVEWTGNFFCGPVPVTISFGVTADIDVTVSFVSKSAAKAMLLDTTIDITIEAFVGLGFDYSIAKLKLGIFGSIGSNLNVLYLRDLKNKKNSNGEKLTISGEIGIRLQIKIAFIKYKKTFCSTSFNLSTTFNKYQQIQKQWEQFGYADLLGETDNGRAYSMRLFPNGTAIVEIDDDGVIEDRDYMALADRSWNDGAPSGRRLLKAAGPMTNAMTDVPTNAYPNADPVFTDDGELFLYISDNDNDKAPESVVSYAVKNGSGYENMGAVDMSEGNILGDSSVVASGTGSNAFAAWVKQIESPEKEMRQTANIDDLGMMMNATEVYAGAYDGNAWTVERLTENTVADMAPTVASSDNRAIVAWRSLSATQMPADSSDDITAAFNAENNINYRIYNGETWSDAQIAYNGNAGTVNAIDSAMLSDGTALLVYTVRTDSEDIASTETFYTLIDKDGNAVTTGRLTNDSNPDANAQVAVAGNQFVVGWYSEYDADVSEVDTAVVDEDNDVAHDIRLARINANGSVDDTFPESIGETAINSDFHFSAPAGNDSLQNLSVVWSQAKDSEKEEDAGKYEIRAVRFYEDNGVIGLTTSTDIAETAKYVMVDRFDTYTDNSGTIHTLVLSSDFSSVDGIDYYDSIDLESLGLTATNEVGENEDHLTILEQDPITGIKLGAGTFPASAIEVSADTNLRELTAGLNLPVQFAVKNTGTNTVNTVTVQIGSESKTFNDLAILPGQSATLIVEYPVPETVADVDYTVTADGSGTASGTLVLNRPDVGISGMKVVCEEDQKRDIQVTLCNGSGIPLEDSGKNVKLAFYKDGAYSQQIGDTISIPATAYADIDDGIYSTRQTLNVSDWLEAGQSEIPDEGIRVYARAWVEDVEELNTTNNGSTVSFQGLLTKYKTAITTDSFLEQGENNSYTVSATVRNNSLQTTDLGEISADILDGQGKVLKNVPLTNNLTLTGEQKTSLTGAFTLSEGKTPAAVVLRSSAAALNVLLDANGGTIGGTDNTTVVPLTKDGKLPNLMPTASIEGKYFIGWFTKKAGGQQAKPGDTVTADMTLYAHFSTDERPYDLMSVTVDDQIALNLFLDLDYRDKTADDVSITLGGKPYACEGKKMVGGDYNGLYEFKVYMAPAEIAKQIVLTIDGDAEPLTTSIKEYCDELRKEEYKEYPEAQALAKAMLEYGQAANNVFLGDADEIADISALSPTAAQNAATVFNDGTGKVTGASFMALTKPEFRFYTGGITEQQGYDYNQAGVTATMENGGDDLNARFVKKADKSVLLEVTGITAENMDKTVTVTVADLGTITFNGNAFAKAMAKSTNEAQQKLGAALYNYGVAANDCFNKGASVIEPPAIEPNVILGDLTSSRTLVDGDIVSGTLAGNYQISIADGATITLMNANITCLPNSRNALYAGLTLLGSATIILEGENAVKGAYDEYPGIYVPQNQTLTINGTGSLNASSNGWGCGIGGGYNIAAGNIEINGGTVTATGGLNAAGIGSGSRSNCGSIVINGGTVTAVGGNTAAGIGSGNSGTCGTITISGGTVTATSGYNGAGIGCGFDGKCDGILIKSGATVTATKEGSAPSAIGKGLGSCTCPDPVIEAGANVIQN